MGLKIVVPDDKMFGGYSSNYALDTRVNANRDFTVDIIQSWLRL